MTKKGAWKRSAYRELCRRLGQPANSDEKKNLWGWAKAMKDSGFYDGESPKEAVHEEIQAGL